MSTSKARRRISLAKSKPMKRAEMKREEPHKAPGFGRLWAIDYRDHLHPMAAHLPLKIPGTHRMHHLPPVLDQGSTSQCVAYSHTTMLQAGPVTNPAPHVWGSIEALYNLAQRADEYPGENYDGTSVRAGMKVSQAAGYVPEFVWASDAWAAANWILARGPIVLGIDWLETMSNTEKGGWCRVRAELNPAIEGGHAIAALGVDLDKRVPASPRSRSTAGRRLALAGGMDPTRGAIYLQNSWGKSWGRAGRAWLSLADLDILLKSGGEACTATEIKLPKVKAGARKAA